MVNPRPHNRHNSVKIQTKMDRKLFQNGLHTTEFSSYQSVLKMLFLFLILAIAKSMWNIRNWAHKSLTLTNTINRILPVWRQHCPTPTAMQCFKYFITFVRCVTPWWRTHAWKNSVCPVNWVFSSTCSICPMHHAKRAISCVHSEQFPKHRHWV